MNKDDYENTSNLTVGDALDQIEKGSEDSLTLLRMIEGNTRATSVVQAIKSAIPAKEAKRVSNTDVVASASTDLTGTAIPYEKIFSSKPARRSSNEAVGPAIVIDKSIKSTPLEQNSRGKSGADYIAPASTIRDSSGKFASSKDQEVQSAIDRQNKTLLEILKGGASKTWQEKKGDVKDMAGRAALGPLWDVGKQIQETYQSAKEKTENSDGTVKDLKTWAINTAMGKTVGQKVVQGKQWATDKFSKKNEKAQAAHNIAQLKHDKLEAVSDKAEATHNLLQAKTDKDKLKAGTTAKPAGVTQVVNNSGSDSGILENILGGKMLKDMLPKKIIGLFTGLASYIGPAVAVAIAGAAGAAVGTGISKLLDKAAQKLTGDKDATAGGAAYDAVGWAKNKLGFGPGASVRDTIGKLESGGKGYSALQRQDSGIVSYGKYQFTAANGKDSSLATVLDKYAAGGGVNAAEAQKYSAIIKAGGAGAQSLRNDPHFKAMLEKSSNEKVMQDAQEKTFDENYFNPAMAYGQKRGINIVKNQRVAGFLADTKVQGGLEDNAKTGSKGVVTQAEKKLNVQGLDWKTANEDQQLEALASARKERLAGIANSQLQSSDPSKRANGQMLLNDSRDGGRVDKVVAMLKNTKIDNSIGFQTAEAAKAGVSAIDAPPGTPEYAAMQAKFLADQQATPGKTVPFPVDRKISKKRVAPATVAKNEEIRPVIDAFALAKPDNIARAETIPTKANGFNAEAKTSAKAATPANGFVAVAQGRPEYKLPPEPKPIRLEPPKVAGMEQLMAAIQQQTQQVQAQQTINKSDKGNDSVVPNIPNIPTEFSDVQLTLMAYDRV